MCGQQFRRIWQKLHWKLSLIGEKISCIKKLHPVVAQVMNKTVDNKNDLLNVIEHFWNASFKFAEIRLSLYSFKLIRSQNELFHFSTFSFIVPICPISDGLFQIKKIVIFVPRHTHIFSLSAYCLFFYCHFIESKVSFGMFWRNQCGWYFE